MSRGDFPRSLRARPDRLIGFYRTVMRLDGVGKQMGAIVFRHKVKVRHMGWLQRRFDGRNARVADRPRREGRDAIGVIGIGILQIFARQVTVEILDSVNHRRVALQRHLLL